MGKRNKNKRKTKLGISKNTNKKFKLNKINMNSDNKRIVKKKLINENEFITDLSFIDKYEEEENKRIINKEKENIIKIRNKKIYKLKICYRPLTNNIELIGNYYEKKDELNDILIDESENKCGYLLNKDNNIVVPLVVNDILNSDKNLNLYNAKEDPNEKQNKIAKIKNQEILKKKILKKYMNNSNKSYYYFHICKNNLINCILLNDFFINNYINIFLSGHYSGFFEDIKNNQKILKIDNFDIFLNENNFKENEFNNIAIIGKGKDEYGDYIIKGNLNLIKDLNQYQNENFNLNEKIIKEKVIKFGDIIFNKIYGL